MTKQSTSVDFPINTAIAPEDAAKFKLDPHLLDLLWNESFFSAVLRTVTKVKTDMIPTAGVAVVEGDVKLWWNPQFVAGLEPKHVRGLLKHEAWHIIFNHITTRRHEPHLLWNYATDWAINSMIPEDELPEGGLRPARPFKPLTSEQTTNLSAEQIERYEKISKFQESLPLEKSAEWYFAALQNDADTKQAVQESTPGNGGELPIDTDDHDAWDQLTDEEREMVKGKIKKALEDAVKEADNGSKGWGSMSSSQRKVIRELVSNNIPWQAILKKFCGFTRRANRASNHKRLNRKYPAIHPGVQRGYTSSIAVYIDQSGSVSDASLEMLFAELRSLAKRTEFVCYHFDTEVDESSETIWRRGKTPVTNRTRCGGTDFSAPTLHANKNKHRFDGYLILTDGEATDPGPSKLKRGWIIVPNRKLYFDASKRDFVINMKDEVQR